MLVNRTVGLGLACILLVILLGGCVRSETELLTTVEAKVRTDPFLVQFRRSMERAFGCEFDADPDHQITSVYLSLFAEVGYQEDENSQKQFPTLKIDVYCHSAIVERVYLDIHLWRGDVESFDQFEHIKPSMINRIWFEPSDSFVWWISERRRAPSQQIDASETAISAPIWTDFASQISSMFPQGCKPLNKDAVFFKDRLATITSDVPYQEFSTVLSCPKPGPLKPGFSFRGLYFPTKSFVLPSMIETGGAYVD